MTRRAVLLATASDRALGAALGARIPRISRDKLTIALDGGHTLTVGEKFTIDGQPGEYAVSKIISPSEIGVERLA